MILNSIVGAMGNLLEVKLDYTLPEVQSFFYPEQEEALFKGSDSHVSGYQQYVYHGGI